MEIINKPQLIALNTLVSKLNIDKESKAMMVEGFSGGRCTSSKDLYSSEANAIIKHLKSLDPEEPKADKMRKKIIMLAHEMGWKKEGKADIERINGWCLKFGYLKKPLDRHTYKELPKLVTQFEGVYSHFLKSI